MSSSGVYWPESNPSGNSLPPPKRGSKRPGEYFYYNNWDYNVAGTAFEQLTGKAIFRALAEDLATPLQFEDFTPPPPLPRLSRRSGRIPAEPCPPLSCGQYRRRMRTRREIFSERRVSNFSLSHVWGAPHFRLECSKPGVWTVTRRIFVPKTT